MASTNQGATQVANYIPEQWALGATDAVEYRAVIAKRVNREFEGTVADMGDTVRIPGLSNFTAVDKSTNTDLDAEAHVHPMNTLLIDKHKAVAVKLERFAEKQALPGYKERLFKRLGYPLARAMETDLSALFDNFADNGTIGTLGVELTDGDYLTAWTKLVEAGAIEEAMTDEDTSIFLSAAAFAAALKIDRFASKDYGAADAVSKAALGAIYGSRAHLSLLLYAPASGQHACAWIHKNALTLAVQQKVRVETDYRPMAIATEMVADTIYGLVELARPFEAAANVVLTDNFGVYLATV